MDVKTLHQHIRNGDVDAVHRLVESGVDVNHIYCRDTAFSLALDQQHMNSEIVKLLFSCPQFDPLAKNHFDRTPLFCASKIGNVDIVNHLLTLGADLDLDQTDLEGVTALGATTWCNAADVAKMLIRAGADVNKCDKRGQTPLFRACSDSARDVARVLLDNGCNVNTQTHDLQTPLMQCIPSSFCTRHPCEKTDLLNMLIKYNCAVNLQDKCGCTALHLAVERKQLLHACILAESGCDMTIQNKDGLSALHVALSPGRQQYRFASCLIAYGTDLHVIFPEFESDTGPIALILKGMLTSMTSPKASSSERRLLLGLIMSDIDHFRVNKNKLQKLLDIHIQENGHHKDFDIIGNFCRARSPDSLQGISRRTIRRMLSQRIFKKVDPLPIGLTLKTYLTFGLNCRGANPVKVLELQSAVQTGQVDKIHELLKTGVDVNFPFLGNTTLAFAVENHQDRCVEVLLSAGADPNVNNLNGDSVLHVAARVGNETMLNFFIQYGCDVNTKNKSGNLPIHDACRNGKFSSAQLLMSKGSDVSLLDSSGIYPIHYVAASGDVTTMHQILAKDRSINVVDSFGNTPLHLAASNGLLYLRQNIPLPALYSGELAMNLDMMNILHCNQRKLGSGSVASGHREVACHLLREGCDKAVENNTGQTALSVAEEFGCLDYFQINEVIAT